LKVEANMSNINQEHEERWYLENREKIARKFKDRVVVVRNRRVIGTHNSELEAMTKTMKMHPIGSFLVRHCCEECVAV